MKVDRGEGSQRWGKEDAFSHNRGKGAHLSVKLESFTSGGEIANHQERGLEAKSERDGKSIGENLGSSPVGV